MSQAKNVSKLRSLGLQGPYGRRDYNTESFNLADGYFVTVEIPLVRVASAAAQTTVVTPSPKARFVQIVQAVLVTTTAEVTGVTKTVSIGIGGAAANVMADTSVAAVGAAGSPVTAAINVTPANNKFTYTLGGADFAQFAGYAVLTCFVIE